LARNPIVQSTANRQLDTAEQTRHYMFPMVVIGLVLLFLAAPWSWQHKAHVALHGLCAQTPSHTLLLGGHALPFDSRMTGIYGGFLSTMIMLFTLGRHRAARLPSWPVIALLVLLVGAMAIDGFNSLLLDMMKPHLYQPDNRLRLVTGMGTGIALAVILCFLFAVSLWSRPNMKERVLNGRDLMLVVPAQIPFIALVLSGAGWLAFPMSLLLVVAALSVLSSLALVSIVLFRYIDCTFTKPSELQGVATLAILVAVVVMAGLSGGRFVLENVLNLQPLP